MSSRDEKIGPIQTRDGSVDEQSLGPARSDILPQGSVDPVYQAKAELLNAAIQEIGMGKYQWHLFIVTGFGWLADNLWPIVTGLILAPVVQEFKAKGPFLKLAQNIGLLVGALGWGVGSDIWGRKLSFNTTLAIVGVFSTVAAGSPTFTALSVFAALWSVGVGGNLPVDSAIFLEFLPGSHQFLLTILSIWWAFGQLLGSLVAWPIISNYSCEVTATTCSRHENMGWRYFLIAMGGLMILLWIIRFFVFRLYESPKYLMGRGRFAEAVDVVHAVAKYNGKSTALTVEQLEAAGASTTKSGEAVKDSEAARQTELDTSTRAALKRKLEQFNGDHVRALFATRKLAISTSLVIAIWAIIGLAFPLYNAFVTYFLATRGADFGDGSVYITYRNQVILSVIGVPGALLGGWAVEVPYVGRRGTLSITTILTGVFLFASTTARSSDALLGWNCGYSFTSNIMYGVLYAMTPELFPTKDRGTGNGIAATANRIFGIMAPIIALKADLSTPVPIYVSGALFILGGLVALLLPFEPRGKAKRVARIVEIHWKGLREIAEMKHKGSMTFAMRLREVRPWCLKRNAVYQEHDVGEALANSISLTGGQKLIEAAHKEGEHRHTVAGAEAPATSKQPLLPPTRSAHRFEPTTTTMSSAQPSDPRRKLVRSDPNTIRGKFLVGYRGWYTCPGDGPKLVQGDDWAHWTNEQGQFNPELVPDPAYYAPEDLLAVPQTQSKVFSSRNVSVVRRHMNILAQHGIDGVFLTRRGQEIAAAYQGGNGVGVMKMRSETVNHVFRSAEQEGRIVSVMYDLSGIPSYQIEQWVIGDWDFLVNQKHVLDSPAYVREQGKPVIALWGAGFKSAGQDPQTILNLIRRLSEASDGAYVILGVPVTWRKQDNSWQTVYQVADALAPLSIGTLVDEESVNNWSKDVQNPAIQALRAGSKKQDYVGVVWPGHEGNLLRMGISCPAAPRRDGSFLWRQVYNAHHDGAKIMYGEMLDGFDDGTAILPSIGATQSGTPSDWYLRICGYASEALKGEKHLYEDLPRKELAEYWGTRPHYAEEQREDEPAGGSSGAAASAGAGASAGGSGAGSLLAAPVRAPTRSMTADFGDAPPPYTLEPETPAGPSANTVYTAEPESVAPAPGPSSSQTSYQTERPTAPPMNRTDSVNSVASSSHSQQQHSHRPGRISVPEPGMNMVPVQTPSTYGPARYSSMGVGSDPSSPAATSPPPQRIDSVSSANTYGRPPQHPAAASRPPPVPSTRPPGPARPHSATLSSHSTTPSPYNAPPTPGSVQQLSDQMQAMNVGGRPAPEHAFAGAGLSPLRPVSAIPGPASPFEGVNRPPQLFEGANRLSQSFEGANRPPQGAFNAPQPPSLPPRQGQGQGGYDVPQAPPTPGSIPGSPFYPGPLQHGHGLTHQGTMGPVHQATMGPVHQPTLGPTHQPTLGPQHQSPSIAHQPSPPMHQHTLGPQHQHTLGPQGPQQQHTLGPQHQPTMGPSHTYPAPAPSPQPPQPTRPGQPPQPSFQPTGPYVPHHQATGYHSPGAVPSSQQGYFAQPPRRDSHPTHPGYQSPQPPNPQYPQHGGPQPGGYPPNPQQPSGGWHSPPQHPQQSGGGGYPPQQPTGGYPTQAGSAGHSPQPQSGPPLHPVGAPGGYSPHVGGQPGYGPSNLQGPGGQRPTVPGSQYVDQALGMVGKYAGEDTKKKLESGVASALGAGTKLWGRFAK